MTTVINYDAIVQELEKGLALSVNHSLNCLGIFEKSDQLKELFTVGMRLPRQTGLTRFIVESMIKNPDSLTVVLNETMKNFFVDILKHMVSAAKSDGTVSVRGVFMYPQTKEITDLINGFPDVLDNIESRIITIRQLHSHIKNRTEFKKPFSRIYLDHGTSIFTSIRSKKYYDWLANQSDNHISTWVIN